MMHNFKKFLATATAVAVISTQAMSAVVYGATSISDPEFDAALSWMYDNGLTKYDNADAFRPFDNLRRDEAAKFFVNFMAAAKLNVTENADANCMFTDLADATSDLLGDIDASCKLGLFKGSDGKFMPAATLTKAQAIAVLVRGMVWPKDEAVSPWYKNYFETARDLELTKETDVMAIDKNVTRYEIALMLFRAAGGTVAGDDDSSDDDSDDDGLGDLLAGLIGDDDDDSDDDSDDDTSDDDSDDDTSDDDDTTVVVEWGDIEISLNPASPASGTQIPNVGTVRFAVIDFTAGDKDVAVNTVDLTTVWLAAVPTSTRIWFEKDWRRLSGKSAFSSDRRAVVSFAPAYVVKAGTTATLDLYVELSAAAGNDFQFAGEIASSSAENNLGDFVTNPLRTATYTVAASDFSKAGSSISLNQSNDLIEVGRFTIQNQDTSSETRDLKFQSVTLRQNGNGDLFDLSDLQLERNWVAVSSEVSISGKDATFISNDIVKDWASATYYIKAKVVNVQNNAWDTYQFSLRNTTDLSIVEVLNGFRSTITITNNDLNTTTVLGSDITFERDSSVELSRNYAKGTNDVVFMQGTIKTKSPITLEDPTLWFSVSAGTIDQYIDTVYLQIGSSTMTWSATWASANFLWLATVSTSANVKMYAKLRDNAPAGTIKFDDLRLSSFGKAEYISNQNTVSSAVGTISAVNVSVDSTSVRVTRVDGLWDTTIAVGSDAVEVYGLSLAVTQGNPVSISNASYTLTWVWSYAGNMFATLFIDGTAVSTQTVNSNTVTFNNVTKTLTTTPLNMMVKVDLSDAFASWSFNLQLTSLDMVDTLTSQNVALGSTPTSANFTVAQAVGILSSSDANPKKSLLLAWAKDVKLLAFRVKAENDTIKLRDLSFTGMNLDSISNVRVLTPSNATLPATSNNSTAVSFTNLSPSDSIVKERTETYYLIADLNTNVNNVDIKVNLDLTGSTIRSTNWLNIPMVWSVVAGNTHTISENTAVVAKLTNSSKDLATSALRFSVTASGKDQVTMTWATFDNVLSGYTGATTLTVYKSSIWSSNVVGTGSVTWSLTFTANNTVDAGSTVNYIVTIDGTQEASANNPSWTVRLNNIEFGAINASDYENMWSFPITEVR